MNRKYLISIIYFQFCFQLFLRMTLFINLQAWKHLLISDNYLYPKFDAFLLTGSEYVLYI